MNKLSDRLRANVECAPWVVSEVVELETLIAQQAAVIEQMRSAIGAWERSDTPEAMQASEAGLIDALCYWGMGAF